MRSRAHRTFAFATLALFVLGGNFCSFSLGPAAGGPRTLAARAALHPCCATKAHRSTREADATRESTAPCCVTVAPVVAAHAVTLDAAPAAGFALATLAPDLNSASPAAHSLAAREDARPPDRDAATPDAGRAPPRL